MMRAAGLRRSPGMIASLTPRALRASPRLISSGSRANLSDEFGDHSWRQQNHIWSEAEIAERMLTADLKHAPAGFSELCLHQMVRTAYHTFNWATGYYHEDPPVSAIGYRLIILESIAGVPGMLGGMFRHFRSLRQ